MAKRNPKHPNIARIDQPEKRTYGWYVRVRQGDKVVSKFFPDLRAGGKAKALAEAQRFRDKLQGKRGGTGAKAGSPSSPRVRPRLVVLAADVAAAFPDAAAVNGALRQLLTVARRAARPGRNSRKA